MLLLFIDLMPATTAVPPIPTTPPPFCREGYLREVYTNYSSIRSMYGTFQSVVEFRFEVCIGGRFTSVCDIGWDDLDAAVVCRELRDYLDGSKCNKLSHSPLHKSIHVHTKHTFRCHYAD